MTMLRWTYELPFGGFVGPITVDARLSDRALPESRKEELVGLTFINVKFGCETLPPERARIIFEPARPEADTGTQGYETYVPIG
jgi:hypothetical protein